MTKADIETDIALLDLLQAELEDSIFNYSLEEAEDLYDEDNDMILRALLWSVGTSNYYVVINPLGLIKRCFSMSPDDVEEEELGGIPNDLMLQVTNTILSFCAYDIANEKDKE